MSKTKRTEREIKDHIAMLEYSAEEAERKLTAMHEAKDKAERDAQKDADDLASCVNKHVKQVKAARALIAELDDFTDACVVKEQAGNIVDILVQGATGLAFHIWVRSTRQLPDDGPDDDAKTVTTTTEAERNIPF
jgi:hypothetical protein